MLSQRRLSQWSILPQPQKEMRFFFEIVDVIIKDLLILFFEMNE